jgi:hypothetical protein
MWWRWQEGVSNSGSDQVESFLYLLYYRKSQYINQV